MGELSLESSAFAPGKEIPKKYGYKYENVSPPLKIKNIPKDTKSLAIIMDDPDAMGAVGKIWVHWIIWNINPTITEISEGTIPSGTTEGMNDFGEIGYGGPAPPDKRHTYIFKLYALKTKLDLKQGSTKAQLEHAMKNQILANISLQGTFVP
jgi:Raf kinase inhibitor-like YbhB/YbcL family protein